MIGSAGGGSVQAERQQEARQKQDAEHSRGGFRISDGHLFGRCRLSPLWVAIVDLREYCRQALIADRAIFQPGTDRSDHDQHRQLASALDDAGKPPTALPVGASRDRNAARPPRVGAN